MSDNIPEEGAGQNQPSAQARGSSSTARDAKGRFKPGHTGNQKGRPPKRERSFLPRQMTRDILSITEELITVTTADGRKTYTAIELALLKTRKKALDGHGPSLSRLLKMHLQALEDHYDRHRKHFSKVEDMEVQMTYPIKAIDQLTFDWVNFLRTQTRKT